MATRAVSGGASAATLGVAQVSVVEVTVMGLATIGLFAAGLAVVSYFQDQALRRPTVISGSFTSSSSAAAHYTATSGLKVAPLRATTRTETNSTP